MPRQPKAPTVSSRFEPYSSDWEHASAAQRQLLILFADEITKAMAIDVSNAMTRFVDGFSDVDRATMSYAELRRGMLGKLKTGWRAALQNLPDLVQYAEEDARARQLDMQTNYAARPELVPPPVE